MDKGKNTAGIRGKDDERKLFVGGLPKACTEKELRETFSTYGEIESVNVKIDPYTGQSRGFCFIVFLDPNVVDRVLKSGDILIHNKKVDPRRVTKSTTPGKVFIGGLTNELNEDKVKEYFGQFGKITEVQWPYDKVKCQRRPYLFLTFENRDVVQDLLRSPKQTVNGIELDVKKVKFNPETMWQQGMYGGGRGAPRGYPTAYPPPYGAFDYRDDYYGYDEFYAGDGMDPYYDGYGYEAYAPYSTGYSPRPPRGGRSAGSYARHAPY